MSSELFYDRDAAEYETDALQVITNLLELVSIQSDEHEGAVLADTAFLYEYELTPFDALHAELDKTGKERVLSTEQDYDTVGLDSVPSEPESGE